jgi:Na+-transporting methylmalonyl-CoA/oxaloacetate decarboxylase gamma subunit
LPRDESNNDRELPDAEPCVQSFMQLSASHPGITFSLLSVLVDIAMSMMGRIICPTVGSDAEHSEKDDVVQPPRRKRRRVSTEALATGGTALQRLIRPDRGDSSSREAQGSSQRPKRQGKRDTTRQPSSRRIHPGKGRCCNVRGMAPWECGPQPRYTGRFAAYVCGAVHLGPMCNYGRGHDRTENRSSVS